MADRGSGVRIGAVLAMAAALAACAKKEQPDLTPPPPPPAAASETKDASAIQPQAGLTANQRLARVVELLQANDEATARIELDQLLRDEPRRREALVLQQSIEGDPRRLLPGNSFAYVVRPGDTYISLARDYLRDSYKFYALARVNGIAANALKPGDTIQLPGRYREPRRDRDARPRPTPRPRPSAEPPATPATSLPRANPVRAQQLRRAGLESLTAGRTNQAVSRLSQAARLDPNNEAIAADLARARRIQATVKAR